MLSFGAGWPGIANATVTTAERTVRSLMVSDQCEGAICLRIVLRKYEDTVVFVQQQRISWFIYFNVCSCSQICREDKVSSITSSNSTAPIAASDNTVKVVAVRGSVVAERDHWRVYSFPLPW